MSSPMQQALLMASVAGGGGGACDPSFSNVVLLTGFEGTNGSTGAPGMNDESPSAHGTATVVGATIDTSQFAFGASSLHLVAASNGIAWWNISPDWLFGSGQFTVETWVRFNSVPASIQFLVADWTSTAAAAGWYLGVDATGKLSWTVSTTGSNTLNDIAGAWSPSTGVWYHVAVDYDGIKYRGYVNGVMVGSSTIPRTIFNPGVHLALGSNSLGTSNRFDGWLDETRITKGVARYASDSGFAVPAVPFPRVVCSTIWNPADLSADITLSNGNLTATKGTAAGNNAVRSNTTKNSGKLYVEFATGARFAGGNTGVGAADAAAVLTSFGISAVGGTGAFVGGGIFFNGSSLSNLGTVISAGDVVAMAIDFVNSKVWFRLNGGNWNGDVIANQNPATNTGGVNIAALFPSNAAYLIFCSNDNPAGAPFTAASLRTTNAQFGFAKPAGFTSWDGL